MAQQILIESIDRIENELDDENVFIDFVACSLETGQGYEMFLDSLDTIEGIYLIEPYYLSENDLPQTVGEYFCAAFDTLLSRGEIDSINAVYGVIVDHELYGMPNIFLLRNIDSSGSRILDLANGYHELATVEFAHPEFCVRAEKCAYRLFDYYHEYQYHTKKVIGSFNTKSVWDFADIGNPLTVAVLDDGIDSHEDLPGARILDGYDFANDDDDPVPGDVYAHGMGCAGIIASSHTTDSIQGLQSSTGVISLNPHVDILPVKIFKDDGWGIYANQIAEAVTWAYTNGADVLTNSWGFRDPDYDSPTLNKQLENAYLFGRNGRGCPVIFASGNGAQTYPGKVSYPAKLWCCFAVGATHLDDYRWVYSQYGNELDIVAPSGDLNLTGDVWTLDQTGNLGYNPNYGISWDCPTVGTNDVEYDCRFGGTSAACPVVSGIVSLLLARDSTLSSQAVYYILKNSAETDLDWGSITPPHNQYGYGRVDAFRAMLAITWGDATNDAHVNVGDVIYINNYIFKQGPPPEPDVLTGDANCDGIVNAGDPTYLVNYIFKQGPPPQICFEY